MKVPLSQEVRGGAAGEEGGKPEGGFTEGFKKKCPVAAKRAYGKTDARPGVTKDKGTRKGPPSER